MAEKIVKEIEEKKRLPAENRKQILKKVFLCYAFAVVILIYFLYIQLGSIYLEPNYFETISRVSAFVLLGFAIFLFENSYRNIGLEVEDLREHKNTSETIALYGIELLALAVLSLFIPYILSNNIMMLMVYAVLYYYLIKSIFMYKYEERKYQKSLSDIKEIIKKEPRKKGREQND